MTDAEQAYAKAEQEIAEAIESGADWLDFSGEDFRALEALPPQIAQAQSVTRLNLRGTQVSDLSPIAGMTGMTSLSLDGTQVTDLRPLLGMQKLVEAPYFLGLTFRNTAACRLDAEIDRI